MLFRIRELRLWRYPAAAAIVIASALIANLLYGIFDVAGLSMIFITGVLLCAVTLGSAPAYFAAVLAFGIYNYNLVEPRYTLQLDSTQDYVTLVFFLGIAILTATITGRLRDQLRSNALRAEATAALLEASGRLSSASDEDAIRHHLAEHMAIVAKGEALLEDAGQTWRHPLSGDASPPSAETGWRTRTMEADGVALGSAAWRTGPDDKDHPERDRLVTILVDLGAAAILRARLSALQSDLTAAAKTEQLRTALLSSISHDLRTPLAAILASATSLKTLGPRLGPAVQNDLITTIEEEADRLNQFVANLLSMTKLESGALSLERQAFDAAEVVNRAADRVERSRHRPVKRIGARGLVADGDPILLEQALGNVLENAARYSPSDCPISIRCARRAGGVSIEVEDFGPGVPEADLERIFDKFYRSRSSAGISQGTGLGLSIAKGLMEAMNGSIQAKNRPGEIGLAVSLRLPASARE